MHSRAYQTGSPTGFLVVIFSPVANLEQPDHQRFAPLKNPEYPDKTLNNPTRAGDTDST